MPNRSQIAVLLVVAALGSASLASFASAGERAPAVAGAGLFVVPAAGPGAIARPAVEPLGLPISYASGRDFAGAVDVGHGAWQQSSELDDGAGGPPSRGKTLLYSALLPGLGQLKHGHNGAATGFMLVEVASWTSLAVFRIQGDNRKDRYIQYAERFAGVVGASGQPNSYYRSLGRFNRSDPGPGSYNEIEVRLVAKRDLHPGDVEAQQRYIAENSITGDLAWDWESEERRFQYADIRSSSESAYQNSEFAIAGLIGGRILSVMHAVWMTAGNDDSESEDDDADRSSLRAYLAALTPVVSGDLARGESRVAILHSF